VLLRGRRFGSSQEEHAVIAVQDARECAEKVHEVTHLQEEIVVRKKLNGREVKSS